MQPSGTDGAQYAASCVCVCVSPFACVRFRLRQIHVTLIRSRRGKEGSALRTAQTTSRFLVYIVLRHWIRAHVAWGFWNWCRGCLCAAGSLCVNECSRVQSWRTTVCMDAATPWKSLVSSISNVLVQINVETFKGLFLSIGVRKQTNKAIISTLKTIKIWL